MQVTNLKQMQLRACRRHTNEHILLLFKKNSPEKL